MRSKFFRDPLHLQIRFEAVDAQGDPPNEPGDNQISWVVQNLIDTEPFQRLRHIRQNGLTNLVFHGAEHSRFSHSMGVSHVARQMYYKLSKNSSFPENFERKLHVAAASLIHDVGHGPFSHTMEEILGDRGVDFDHEAMTIRFITEESSDINKVLKVIDKDLPERISGFFDKTKRDNNDDWIYKIVSSQMDADRIDYVQRDAMFAGLRGHGFDVERLMDLIFVIQDKYIAVDRAAIEALEAYLVTLDQVWRAIYYHQAVRAASKMLTSLFGRAYDLYKVGDEGVLSASPEMGSLFSDGEKIPLEKYLKLNDVSAWGLISSWRDSKDPVLHSLSNRLFRRNLLKTIQVDPSDFKKTQELLEDARRLTRELLSDIPDADKYFVMYDDAKRTSYKTYNWKPDGPNESIWLTGGGREDRPIEADDESGLITALRNVRRFDRIVLLDEVRKELIRV